MVKNPPAMQETWVRSLGQEDPLEKGLATHSNILAWKIPQTEKPVGYSYGVGESDTTEQLTLNLKSLYYTLGTMPQFRSGIKKEMCHQQNYKHI